MSEELSPPPPPPPAHKLQNAPASEVKTQCLPLAIWSGTAIKEFQEVCQLENLCLENIKQDLETHLQTKQCKGLRGCAL